MKLDKQGQGLSLTTIIVAVIALVVLVVLIAIFMGKMGPWGERVSGEAKIELTKMKINYGDCRPGTAAENGFLSDLDGAGEDEDLKDSYRSDFNRLIGDCKAKTEADCVTPCIWK